MLNDFLSGQRTLKPGGEIEGLLLAVDEKPIPNDYPDQAVTRVELSIFDERRNKYTLECRLLVDRSAARYREKRLRKIADSSKKMPSRGKSINRPA